MIVNCIVNMNITKWALNYLHQLLIVKQTLTFLRDANNLWGKRSVFYFLSISASFLSFLKAHKFEGRCWAVAPFFIAPPNKGRSIYMSGDAVDEFIDSGIMVQPFMCFTPPITYANMLSAVSLWKDPHGSWSHCESEDAEQRNALLLNKLQVPHWAQCPLTSTWTTAVHGHYFYRPTLDVLNDC